MPTQREFPPGECAHIEIEKTSCEMSDLLTMLNVWEHMTLPKNQMGHENNKYH